MKLCVNCKHYGIFYSGHYCIRKTETSPVTGELEIHKVPCNCERASLHVPGVNWTDFCGPDARHFAEAPPKPAAVHEPKPRTLWKRVFDRLEAGA